MLINNLSNILLSHENNENLINTFIDKFDNFTNLLTKLDIKFSESINFCMNIFDFEYKEKFSNSKESLKINHMFNSVFMVNNAPLGKRQNKLNQILLENNDDSIIRNNSSRITNYIKNDKNNNNNSSEKKQKFLKKGIKNIGNSSKYSTNSNGNYGFTINLNNPQSSSEGENTNSNDNNEYSALNNEEYENNIFINDSFSQKQNFFDNILNISNIFSMTNWRLLIILLEQIISTDFLFEEYKFLLKFNNFLMHLWKEEEFSNSLLKNTIFKCFPLVMKYSPKNERDNLHKIIQKDIVENKSFYIRRLFFPYFESCLNTFSLNYLITNHVFEQFFRFFDDNKILICNCLKLLRKIYLNFDEESSQKYELMKKIQQVKDMKNPDYELKKVIFLQFIKNM